jgi:hypothetical protein
MAETPVRQLSEAEMEEIHTRAEGWSDQLSIEGAAGAEQAFEIGCGLGLIPSVVLIIALWGFGVIPLILAAVMMVIALLLLAGISMLIANVARHSAIKRMYQTTIAPDIAQFLSNRHIPRQSFDDTASRLLPEDAPLQAFLSPAAEASG